MSNEKKVRLCATKYTGWYNNYDNCMKEELEGCEGCPYYVAEIILKLFKKYENEGFPEDETFDELIS